MAQALPAAFLRQLLSSSAGHHTSLYSMPGSMNDTPCNNVQPDIIEPLMPHRMARGPNGVAQVYQGILVTVQVHAQDMDVIARGVTLAPLFPPGPAVEGGTPAWHQNDLEPFAAHPLQTLRSTLRRNNGSPCCRSRCMIPPGLAGEGGTGTICNIFEAPSADTLVMLANLALHGTHRKYFSILLVADCARDRKWLNQLWIGLVA